MTDNRIPFPDHAWPLLRKALEHIAAHPDEFYMPEWVVRITDLAAYERAAVQERTGHPLPACGTVACLAGHIALAAGAEPDDLSTHGNVEGKALRALGLNDMIGAGYALVRVFGAVGITRYDQLADALNTRFTFPEPLPSAP